jgi:hypothetical protein
VANHDLTHPEFIGKPLLTNPTSGKSCTDGSHVGISKFRAAIALSALIGTAFGTHVPHVIGMRAQEEVIGSHAGWVVAPMQDLFVGRNRAKGEYPGDAVGLLFVAQRLPAVAIVVRPTGPEPAPGLCPYHVCPESPDGGFTLFGFPAIGRAETSLTAVGDRWAALEGDATPEAAQSNHRRNIARPVHMLVAEL